ncbi:unnamed protein product [Cylindrotheca closterium]|uniref:Calcium/calmodulin-dependent protein kinase II association-domain domain-containing protein n=1 Tax=Cylindrotheca closterium TaxID=2856 RepID=A0AAD2G133_9STRA|nr:unnamed protein product [Cylindrotheca closterium]
MKLETYRYLAYFLTVLGLHNADGFTNPAVNSFSRIQQRTLISSPSSFSTCSSSSSLNAFGIQTLKRILREDPPPRRDLLQESITKEQVRNLFTTWNEALLTGDSEIVAKCYCADPILLPTVSDTPRTDFDGIKNYFDKFLTLKPCGKILDGKIKCGPGWAQDAGIYEFTLGANGSKTLQARYSFVYVFEDGQWKISHHHSSVMPESTQKKTQAKILSQEEVKGLFYLWNEALETRDPHTVAKRYTQNAVLLPTVSDIPRSDYEGIKDYFAYFLKLEPKGEILESHVTCGENWCEDVGIYEFTLGATGDKVRARYSFVYVLDNDGEWKISHHHSSKMPEAPGPVVHRPSEDQVRSLFDTWNEALISLDPDQVAKLYSKNAVLLPTVSDRPRYTYDAIRDYFVQFLFKYPEGEILESHVTTGDNWCKNVGIYQFRMALTGEVVMARYSFVYVWEDGEWKISHHHSSFMPEPMLAATAAAAAIRLEEIKMEPLSVTNHTQMSP